MTDATEPGPDPNQVRRHAKKMLTELQYRQKYRRIDFYRPHPKQLEFHNLIATEKMLRAGNQVGKTFCCAAQLAMDALCLYPDWYTGRRFDKKLPIERAHEFLAWVACTTSTATRDAGQLKLWGDCSQADGLGQGLIPLDSILSTVSARGVANFLDGGTVRRETGGTAIIRQKTFEMDRKQFQGESVDEIWLDEDSGDDVIYGECLARLTATKGQIISSMTPVLGRTPIRKRYIEGGPGIAEVVMGLDDALHIDASERDTIRMRYKSNERQSRADGADMAGEGAVFVIPESEIKHSLDPSSFPDYWQWLAAVDYGHGGMADSSHPFAYVAACRDPDTDCIYITHTIRMRQSLPVQHVAAIKHLPIWDCKVAWPHDGQQREFGTGETITAVYKKLGLNMRPTWAVFPDSNYNFEAGISEMEQRMASGRLKVASHLGDWLDEFRQYHRVNGLVHKVDDDLLSATRQLVMDIRFAKPLSENRDAPGAYRGWDGSFRRSRDKDKSYVPDGGGEGGSWGA